jgi:hypothetical protein
MFPWWCGWLSQHFLELCPGRERFTPWRDRSEALHLSESFVLPYWDMELGRSQERPLLTCGWSFLAVDLSLGPEHAISLSWFLESLEKEGLWAFILLIERLSIFSSLLTMNFWFPLYFCILLSGRSQIHSPVCRCSVTIMHHISNNSCSTWDKRQFSRPMFFSEY